MQVLIKLSILGFGPTFLVLVFIFFPWFVYFHLCSIFFYVLYLRGFLFWFIWLHLLVFHLFSHYELVLLHNKI